MLENFDFSVLSSANFLEDSVREEIITPILHTLGYSVSGDNQIIRSKSLTHPFVYIGTQKRKISIIPDYILSINGIPRVILDAKAPSENIVSGKNVEQAFSYAIHKDIRVRIYALCNGRELTIFSISEYEPLAKIDLANISETWSEIEYYLKPEHIESPFLADFKPDLGLTLLKLNSDISIEYHFTGILISMISKLDEEFFTVCSSVKYDNNDFLISIDMTKDQYVDMLEILPPLYKKELEFALTRQPFKAVFKDGFELGMTVIANLTGEVIKSYYNENFVPFRIKKVIQYFT